MGFDSAAVLAYIHENGPAVPNQIRKALGAQDNFVVGAVLSELASSGKLALTNLDYGTSKFYYDPSEPEKIEPLAQYLGEKDLRAYQLLKQDGVLRHSELSPLNRVAVASIKDFSRPVRFQTADGEELFWRHFLLSEDEALERIIRKWFPELLKPVAPPPVAPVEPAQEAPRVTSPTETVIVHPEPHRKPPKAAKRAPRAKPSPHHAEKAAPVPRSRAPAAPSEFSTHIAEYFSTRNIKLDEDLGSSKTELTAIVRVPSAIGEMRYYCKARTKKLTADGDLAAAYLEAQKRGLPLLYLAAGTLSKKAQEVLPTLNGAVVAHPFSNAEAEY